MKSSLRGFVEGWKEKERQELRICTLHEENKVFGTLVRVTKAIPMVTATGRDKKLVDRP